MTNTTSIRVFNEDGINEFERIINEIRKGNMSAVPEDLIYSSNFSDYLIRR